MRVVYRDSDQFFGALDACRWWLEGEGLGLGMVACGLKVCEDLVGGLGYGARIEFRVEFFVHGSLDNGLDSGLDNGEVWFIPQMKSLLLHAPDGLLFDYSCVVWRVTWDTMHTWGVLNRSADRDRHNRYNDLVVRLLDPALTVEKREKKIADATANLRHIREIRNPSDLFVYLFRPNSSSRVEVETRNIRLLDLYSGRVRLDYTLRSIFGNPHVTNVIKLGFYRKSLEWFSSIRRLRELFGIREKGLGESVERWRGMWDEVLFDVG